MLGQRVTVRGDQGRLLLGQRVASKSEVIRAIVSGHSPSTACAVPGAVTASLNSAASSAHTCTLDLPPCVYGP